MISTVLSFLRSKLLWIGIAAAAAVGGYLYISILYAKIDAAEARAANAIANQAAAEKALDLAKAEHAKAVAALESDRKAAEQRAVALSEARRKVDSAPASDDGDVAPVLRSVLDSLRSAKP